MNQTAPRHLRAHFAVTGASSGIGRAIALRLAREGANLTLIARRESHLEAVAADAIEAGATIVQTCPADVRDQASMEAAFQDGFEVLGPFGGVIAAAGIGGPNQPGPEDRFQEIVQTNLNGAYYALRAAQSRLAPGPETRHMVVISSILGRFGVAGYTGYCASKAGLLGLVRALAHELAPANVQVNAVCPGWVDTEMAWQGIDGMAAAMGATREKALQVAMRQVPLGRMSTPDEVAGLVSWLVGPDARGVTGQGLDINNGAWMG